MKTRATLAAENKALRNEVCTLKIWLRAYRQENIKLQNDIDVLNASLNCTASEMERWQDIAKKADERRLAYVRGMVPRD